MQYTRILIFYWFCYKKYNLGSLFWIKKTSVLWLLNLRLNMCCMQKYYRLSCYQGLQRLFSNSWCSIALFFISWSWRCGNLRCNLENFTCYLKIKSLTCSFSWRKKLAFLLFLYDLLWNYWRTLYFEMWTYFL